MEYNVIKSDRKTFSIQVGPAGATVRVPKRAGKKEIDAFIEKYRDWAEKKYREISAKKAAQADVPPLTQEEIRVLAEKAKKVIPPRVEYYAKLIGVTYGRITVRSQKTRWGSCSAAGNLNFNCLLMLVPEEVADSVIVHELCHRKEMNHSKSFYREIYRVFPDYDRCSRWLKENGAALIQRMTD